MTTKLSISAHTFGRMALALACMMPACIQAAPGDAARKVIMRTYGIDTHNINFKQLPSNGTDRYAYDCQNGKLTISGSSENAMAYAFYKYQAATSQGMATWSGNAMPQQFDLKPCKEQQGQSPYRYRYFLNVCTFGYTTPYWDWNRWEKELDLMALHGINMPLASVAHEAIAERVWLKMGLKKEDIRSFFTGAAYLPWHRMGNLNTWDGPLTDAWQTAQVELQHKILKRMRELDMHPIAPAFAGFVPEGFMKLHPEIKMKHLKWGGFDQSMNAYVLPPDSPYFEEIGKLFIQEWEKEFGKNKFYQSDSFNEMELPVDPNDREGKLRLLEHYGDVLYRSVAKGNPDAVWVTQGWTFGYQHGFWDRESLAALQRKVPNDKMMIIDLANDYPKWVWHTELTWKVHDGYYGKQWVYSYVPNFGGKTLLTGDMDMYAKGSAEALAHPAKGNLVGFGSAPEGIENNDVVYELLADMGWSDKAIDLDAWLANYCTNRYGGYDDNLCQAWKDLRGSAYSSLYSYPRYLWQTVVSDTRRPSKTDLNDQYFKAVQSFLASAPKYAQSKLYEADAVLLAAQYVGAKADILYRRALHADSVGQHIVCRQNLYRVFDLLEKADRLLASHPTDRLDRWIDMARNNGTTAEEKDRYEADAKRLITTWGGWQEDYAARFWNGLISQYYIPRLKAYFFGDPQKLDQWEEKWVTTPLQYKLKPYDNPVKEAAAIVDELKDLR